MVANQTELSADGRRLGKGSTQPRRESRQVAFAADETQIRRRQKGQARSGQPRVAVLPNIMNIATKTARSHLTTPTGQNRAVRGADVKACTSITTHCLTD